MTRVLFVCHGNICRSPMAEFVFRAMVQKAGRAQAYEVQSAALSGRGTGQPGVSAGPCHAGAARHFVRGEICGGSSRKRTRRRLTC